MILQDSVARKRANSLRSKALQSLKKISQDCYDLTNPSFQNYAKPLLCQTQFIIRTTPRLNDTQQSINIRLSSLFPKSSRSITSGHKRTTSILVKKIDNEPDNQIFCRKVYTTKILQLQAKKNKKQQDIFVKRLSKALTKTELNATGYDLGPNAIKQICNYLVNSSLQVLILDKNNLRDDGIISLSKIVAGLRLVTLSLVSVNMSEIGCRKLIPELGKISTLSSLNLSSFEGFNRNKLHKNSLQNIGHLLNGNKCNLKYLNISNTGTDDHSFMFLCAGLNKHSFLQHLDIQLNQISELGMTHFKDRIVKVSLKIFNCSFNKIVAGGLQIMASLIGSDYNLTKISKTLKILKMCGNNIKSQGLHYFCRQIATNQTLQQFYLDDNPLGEGDMFSNFGYFIKKNWIIKKLSLAHSLRSTDDVLTFCDSLDFNRGIETLILSRNNMQLCSFKALMDVLSRNKSLKKIYLQGCNIVDSFIQKSEQQIMHLKYIQEIYLEHNFITDKGALILEKSIFKNKLISKIHIHSNCLSIKMMKELQNSLKHNEQLKKFDGPDLSYYLYVESLQNVQKSNLSQTINDMRERQRKLSWKTLIHHIAKKDIESANKQNQVLTEEEEVNKIIELKDNMNKIAELQKNLSSKIYDNQQIVEADDNQNYTSIHQFNEQVSSQQKTFQQL